MDELFPFLFGGTFIEGSYRCSKMKRVSGNFPSFSEGLSLRDGGLPQYYRGGGFPFLFGGTFIEGRECPAESRTPSGRISLPFRRDFH